MQIVKIQNPFNLADSEVFYCPKQMSVVEIVAEYNVSSQNLPFICFLNGEPLLRQYWNICPKMTDHIAFLCLPQGGGGGGSNPLKVVLSVAVMVAAYYTGGIAAGAYGAFAGAAAATAVSVGGSMLINAVIPSPSSSLSSSYSSPSTRNLKSTSLRDIVATYGNLARNGSEIYLYSYFYVRNPYTVNFRTVFDGSVQAGSMPADETDDIFYVNGVGVSGSTWSISCEPYAFVDVNVTDRLVYTTNGSTTTFYSFDNITVGNRVVSESGTYTFQGMAVNEISSYTVNINFKREFSINTSLLNSDSTPIDYDASIWEVDSAIDLLNIAYRVYCRGYSLANRIVQTADIDFSNVNGGYMLPIGTEAHPFSSVYDGQYHTIENMTIVGGNAQDMVHGVQQVGAQHGGLVHDNGFQRVHRAPRQFFQGG